jgi:hypothetical protein
VRVLTCAAARRRLHAFHDEELPISDQIAVAAHLEWCDTCADALAELRLLRTAIRMARPKRVVLSTEEEATLQSAVIDRVKAERIVSVGARLREMFEDMHLVYAGVGAAVATIVCVVVMLSMMRFATSERPDSLAAMVRLLASPGSNQYPVSLAAMDKVLGSPGYEVLLDSPVRMPRALDEAFSTEPVDDAGEALVTLSAVVTREGRVANLELLNAGPSAAAEAKLVENLMGAVSRARFEPASIAGLPVAVNMVWIVAHTTVRATKASLDLPALPVVKKRIASLAAPGLTRV